MSPARRLQEWENHENHLKPFTVRGFSTEIIVQTSYVTMIWGSLTYKKNEISSKMTSGGSKIAEMTSKMTSGGSK